MDSEEDQSKKGGQIQNLGSIERLQILAPGALVNPMTQTADFKTISPKNDDRDGSFANQV